MNDQYDAVIVYKPERMLRKWHLGRVCRIERSPGRTVSRYPLIGPTFACHYFFTKAGAVKAASYHADEDRRRRRDLASAEVVRLP